MTILISHIEKIKKLEQMHINDKLFAFIILSLEELK